MKVFTCVVIDDDLASLEIMKLYGERCPQLEILAFFNCPIQAIPFINKNAPDVVFTDVVMPKLSGLDMVNLLNANPQIVITSGYTDYVEESYLLRATDYLVKPINKERFIKCVEKIVRHEEAKIESFVQETQTLDSHCLTVRCDYKDVDIPYDEVYYVEAMDNYVKIHTSDRVVLSLRSLKSVLSALPSDDFIQIHRSYLISISKMDRIEANTLTLISGVSLPIGRMYSKGIRNLTKLFR
jgi:DNA-binding LytR/AlgR family response regulator